MVPFLSPIQRSDTDQSYPSMVLQEQSGGVGTGGLEKYFGPSGVELRGKGMEMSYQGCVV